MCSTEYTFYSRIVFTGFKSQKVLSFCGSESSCLTEHKDSDTRPSQGTCVVLAHKRMRTTWCGVSTGDTERDWTYFNHSVNSLQPCGRQEHLSYTKQRAFCSFLLNPATFETHMPIFRLPQSPDSVRIISIFTHLGNSDWLSEALKTTQPHRN